MMQQQPDGRRVSYPALIQALRARRSDAERAAVRPLQQHSVPCRGLPSPTPADPWSWQGESAELHALLEARFQDYRRVTAGVQLWGSLAGSSLTRRCCAPGAGESWPSWRLLPSRLTPEHACDACMKVALFCAPSARACFPIMVCNALCGLVLPSWLLQ